MYIYSALKTAVGHKLQITEKQYNTGEKKSSGFWYAFIFRILQNPVLLSDSRLHLFVQTQLSPEEIEACVSGHTKYSVADAIQEFASLKRRFPIEHEEKKKEENYADSDSERLLPYIPLNTHTW